MMRSRSKLFLLYLVAALATFYSVTSCRPRAVQKADNSLRSSENETTPVRLRRSVFDPANKENVDAYVKAFQILQSSEEGKKFWEELAYIHEGFCPHGNWFFLPWHRVYLYHFERVIASVSGKADFALPYWDWNKTNHNQLPPVARNKDGLFWPGRSPAAVSESARMDESNVGDHVMRRIMSTDDFFAFGSGRSYETKEQRGSGLLESAPHNSIHVWVDGDMASFLSPLDPIFWMHHANVDRIWSAWMTAQIAANRKIVPPDGPEEEPRTEDWLSYQLKEGFLEVPDASKLSEFRPVEKSYAVRETLDSAGTFGYAYDDSPGPAVPSSAAAPPAEGSYAPGVNPSVTLPGNQETSILLAKPVANQSTTPTAPVYSARVDLFLKQTAIFETQRAIVFVIDLKKSNGTDLRGAPVNAVELLKRPSGKATAVLYLQDVPVPTDMKSTSLQFYLNRKPQSLPTREKANFLGSLSFFGLDHAHHGHGAKKTTSVILDVTDLLKPQALAANAANNLFINAFIRYTNSSGEDMTGQREIPIDLKPKLKAMKLRLEYTE